MSADLYYTLCPTLKLDVMSLPVDCVFQANYHNVGYMGSRQNVRFLRTCSSLNRDGEHYHLPTIYSSLLSRAEPLGSAASGSFPQVRKILLCESIKRFNHIHFLLLTYNFLQIGTLFLTQHLCNIIIKSLFAWTIMSKFNFFCRSGNPLCLFFSFKMKNKSY